MYKLLHEVGSRNDRSWGVIDGDDSMSLAVGIGAGMGAGIGTGIAIGMSSGRKQACEEIREHFHAHGLAIHDQSGKEMYFEEALAPITSGECSSKNVRTVAHVLSLLLGVL